MSYQTNNHNPIYHNLGYVYSLRVKLKTATDWLKRINKGPFMNIRNVLKNTYLIDDQLTDDLLSKGQITALPKGKFLFFQEQSAEYIAIPITGILGFYPVVEDGANVSYNLITPGIIFNDVPYILGGGSQADVRAISDCKVLLLSYSHVKELMDSCCAFSKMLNLSLARKQRFCLTLFNLRGEKDKSVKIQKALEAISEVTNDGAIPVNIGVLASLLNMSRNTVGQFISRAIANNELIKSSFGYRLVAKTALAA